MSYQISVLDKSPVAEGASPEQALRNSLQLAQRAEQLGYHRYWFAEHHAAPTLASPAPEVLAAWVLAQTRRIRIGSGGVMLRHYAPYKVAENFNLLAALAPGRVDLGVGKAPGGLPASTAALAAGRPAFADFDQQLRDLEGYLSSTETEAQARPIRSRRRSASCSVPARRVRSRRPSWAGASSTPRTSMVIRSTSRPHSTPTAASPRSPAAGHGGLRRTYGRSGCTAYRCATRLQAAPWSRAGGEPAQPRGGCRVRAPGGRCRLPHRGNASERAVRRCAARA